MNKEPITTDELITLLDENPTSLIECSIRHGMLNCTHFISMDSNTIYDEGIDGEQGIYIKKNWIEEEKDTLWYVDQIIN